MFIWGAAMGSLCGVAARGWLGLLSAQGAHCQGCSCVCWFHGPCSLAG